MRKRKFFWHYLPTGERGERETIEEITDSEFLALLIKWNGRGETWNYGPLA